MKTALVTGASRGLGKAIAVQLEKNNCEVIKTDTKTLDFLDEDSIEKFMYNTYFKGTDILVNNAGIRVGNLKEIMKVNVDGPKKLMDAMIPYMEHCKSGRIVNISSIAGLDKNRNDFYSQSKAMLIELTRKYAKTYARKNILINTICPCPMETDMTNNYLSEKDKNNWIEEIPLHRFVTAEEVAKLVSFLCIDNSFITGQTIVIDGGYML